VSQASGTSFLSYQWYLNGTNLPSANIITTVAGVTGSSGSTGNGGAATNARLANPYGLAVDSAGNIFIADSQNNEVRKVDTNGIITRFAGTNAFPAFSGDGGPATNSRLFGPVGVLPDKLGNVYIADSGNYRIRKVDTNGIITTVAGNGTKGYYGDSGPATNAEISIGYESSTCGMCMDASGNFYFTDTFNNRVRKIDTNGIISTVVGGGQTGGLAMDAGGNLFFSAGTYVGKLDTNNVIAVVAGGGTNLVDGILATNAQLAPTGLCLDTNGNLFIGELLNNTQRVVRKVDTNGIITTVAGRGPVGVLGDGGPATNAYLGCPFAIALDQHGNLLICDELASSIREVWFTGWPTLPLSSLSPSSSGNYQVVVSSSSGSVTSSVANLTVEYPAISGAISGGVFYLNCPVFQPSVLQVQWTTNLNCASWSNIDVINHTRTSSTVIQRQYSATNYPQGFYRVLWSN
jgi:sugar lactone lactonase YvrE